MALLSNQVARRELPDETKMAALREVAARSRPVTTAETRLMRIPGEMAALFPEGGIRKGSTVAIDPAGGGYTLALSMAAAVTSGGGWAAAVGMPSLGLVAAAELGTRLDRLALIPRPGEHWAVILAALVDGFDLVLLRPPGRVRAVEARRLAARARERGTVAVVVGGGWPEAPDIRLSVTRSSWRGLEAGHGHLQEREMEVTSSGRRVAALQRRLTIRLPGLRPSPAVADSRAGPPVGSSPAGSPVAGSPVTGAVAAAG